MLSHGILSGLYSHMMEICSQMMEIGKVRSSGWILPDPDISGLVVACQVSCIPDNERRPVVADPFSF